MTDHDFAAQSKDNSHTVAVQTLLLGERLDLRAFDAHDRLADLPLAIRVGGHGCAVLFRFGVVVLFDVSSDEKQAFLGTLRLGIANPYPVSECDEAVVAIDRDIGDQIRADGRINIAERSVDRLQLVAEVLARSAILSHYEGGIARVFEQVEPFAVSLRDRGRPPAKARALLRQIGAALQVRHDMVGRVEIVDKPELLWERPDLERFYLRLAEEYELRERRSILEHKLELIGQTSVTILQLLHAQRSLRVEWYIVSLIVIEIAMTVYLTWIR